MSKLWLIGLAAATAWTPAALAQGGRGGGMEPMSPAMQALHAIPHKHPIEPGTMLPGPFAGPEFVIHDWQRFGFPQPVPGGRWIRHHQDALLVDYEGRVVDARYDWERRGRGHGGAYGDDGHDRGGDDYAGGDDYGGGDDHGGPPPRMCRRSCAPAYPPPPPPRPAYGYGYGYGYGCGCGPVVITETTTTTPTIVETRTYYETIVERPARVRRYYSKPVPRKPVYRKVLPRAGERG